MPQLLDIESPAVQSYLTILQSVIARMSANSAAAKTWCVAIASAVVVVIAGKGDSRLVWIALLPVILLGLLDAYYLGLERSFCGTYNRFVEKLHGECACVDDIFIVAPHAGRLGPVKATGRAALSLSVWPFYGGLVCMLVAVRVWVL